MFPCQKDNLKLNETLGCINLISTFRDGVCPLFGTHDTTFYPDKFADGKIRELTVICENKEHGCSWSDILGNYEV